MTREKIVEIATSYLGVKEGSERHKELVDKYNTLKPLPRGYKVKYSDAWCALFSSVVFLLGGAGNDFPYECSVEKMRQKAQEIGIWVEDDDYIPGIGDLVVYDWQDTGKGDNMGYPDHIGITEYCRNSGIMVVEGNYSDMVKERLLNVNGKYIRGFITPKFEACTRPVAVKSGAKVKISVGAVYGGLWNGARGVPVPVSVLKRTHTVSMVREHFGEDEALLEEIRSWVAVKYLTVCE